MSAADRIVQPWVTQARSILGPTMPEVKVEDFDGPANAQTEWTGIKILMLWRRNYPMQLHLPSPSPADLAIAAVEVERTSCHELGHGIAAWLRSLGIDVEAELYAMRGFTTTPAGDRALSDAEGVEVGWARHPWERVAETMRAAIGGRWIRPERTLNEGKTIDPMAARAWLLGLVARATPAPGPVPTPTPVPTSGGSMKIIDIRDRLPLVAANVPKPSHATKNSNTVHWTGGSDTIVTDEQAIAAIIRWHGEHIRKDWSDEAGVQGGSGLMYAEVIAPSGTVLITRDPDAILWHSSSPIGNRDSRPILVICDGDDWPSNAQLAALDSRITFPEFRPHGLPGGWIATQCPGPQLRAFIDERRVDDMFTAQDRERLNRIHDVIEAEEPKDWTQRLQDWASRAFKSMPPASRPTDFSGPDVTTNKPRT